MSQLHARDEQGQSGVVKTYSNSRKLLQVAEKPIGVMSWGAGNIGLRSIEGLLREFSKQPGLEKIRTVQDTARALSEFLRGIYETEFPKIPVEQQPGIGLYIAGYSKNEEFAEEWEFTLPASPEPKEVRPKGGFGSSWRGIDIPFTRLYFGFDPRLSEALVAKGVDRDLVNQVVSQAGHQVQAVFGAMPVQDAIDFAVFVLRTTIGYVNIDLGAPSCGGPLQVAIILPQSGFTWIEQPKFSVFP
ncbi:MAG: hypothetical protein ACRDHG_01760 [Anaerolineales bacterium]